MGDALGTALGESVGASDGVLGTDGARVGLVGATVGALSDAIVTQLAAMHTFDGFELES